MVVRLINIAITRIFLFQANKWCSSGMDMLTSQLENCNTLESIRKAIEDIDNFVVTSKDLKLNNPKEFRQLFDSVITSDTRVSIGACL